MKINNKYNIGFIGVGNMASAIITGITSSGYPFEKLFLFDVMPEKTSLFAKKGANSLNSIKEIYDECDCIVLAVKPQNYSEVLSELATVQNGKRVVYISIAAGITTQSVSEALNGAPVIRALPNTPMLIGEGVSVLCRNDLVTDDEYSFACDVFKTAGEVITIEENEMNRIISVTSSSPAYVFMFIKAICDGAKEQGLNPELLKPAVCAVVTGAAKLLAESSKTPDELVSMVCSKGGTTERAVSELEAYRFSEGIVSAMKKCTARAEELATIKK